MHPQSSWKTVVVSNSSFFGPILVTSFFSCTMDDPSDERERSSQLSMNSADRVRLLHTGSASNRINATCRWREPFWFAFLSCRYLPSTLVRRITRVLSSKDGFQAFRDKRSMLQRAPTCYICLPQVMSKNLDACLGASNKMLSVATKLKELNSRDPFS